MKEEILDDLLRRYLQGKLSPAEQEQLEKLLANDPELASELALQRAEMAVSELLIAGETREWFEEWSTPGNSIFGNIRLGWLLAIAATLSLLVAAICFFNRPDSTPAIPSKSPAPSSETPALNPSPSPAAPQLPSVKPETKKPVASDRPAPNYRELAALNAEDPVLYNSRRTPAGGNPAGAFSQAQSAFAAGEFQQTLDLLARPDSARIQSATFLKAHALFRLERFTEAETQFNYLINCNSRQYRYPSEWGLLMCRLAQLPERAPEARQQLREILSNPDHPYFERAKRLEQALATAI